MYVLLKIAHPDFMVDSPSDQMSLVRFRAGPFTLYRINLQHWRRDAELAQFTTLFTCCSQLN